jgi:uncharacterized protein (TIGR02271 family)
MVANRREVVVGVFHAQDQAREAIGALKDAGFGGNDISVLLPDKDQTRDVAADTGTRAGTGAATGAVAGGILGGLGGWLVGIGALAIPGVGPFIAAGAFASALGGAALGAGVGAVAGALVGMGVPKEEAEWYEQEVHSGRALVTVRADGRYDEAQALLRRYGAYDIQSREAGATSAGTSGSRAGASVEQTAPIQRTAVDQPSGTASGRWEDALPQYRQRWQQRYGAQGGRWDEYEPSYYYAWQMHNDPRYRGRSWAQVEPELRRDWETRYPDKPWDGAREVIRETWEEHTDAPRTPTAGEERVRLHEEELRPRKEPVQAGEVGLRKEVVTEQKPVDVPVTKEQVEVERHPVEGRPPARSGIGEGEEVRVPVKEEKVRLEKEPVVTEEVSLGKRPVEQTEQVHGTVRREEARVETEGDVAVRGDEPRRDRS